MKHACDTVCVYVQVRYLFSFLFRLIFHFEKVLRLKIQKSRCYFRRVMKIENELINTQYNSLSINNSLYQH